MTSLQQVFDGVYRINGKLATLNYAAGRKVYGEELVRSGGKEYRIWNPYRSKLGAAIAKGLKELPIASGSTVLYLGAASGTTASHVSDIVGEEGIVYCIEFAKRVMRDLVSVCESRPNMIPLLADARMPQAYAHVIAEESRGSVDCIFEDVADAEQVRIMRTNAQSFLASEGSALIAIKSRSINAVADPKQVYVQAESDLSHDFSILQKIELAPFELDHLFLNLKKK